LFQKDFNCFLDENKSFYIFSAKPANYERNYEKTAEMAIIAYRIGLSVAQVKEIGGLL
jgi:hypothetical protein